MLCSHCNQEVSENAMFCSNCGFQIKKNEVQTNNSLIIEDKQRVGLEEQNVFYNNQQQETHTNQNIQINQPFVQNGNHMNNQNIQPINQNVVINSQAPQNSYAINNVQQNIQQSNPYQVQLNNQIEEKKDKKTILIIGGIVVALLLVCCCCLPAIGMALSLNA